MGLAALLHDGTKPLHTEAERSGVMAALLRGRASKEAYVRLLAALHAIYASLEAELDRHASHSVLGPLQAPGFARRAALESDLEAAAGPHWRTQAPADPLALAYAAHLRLLSQKHPERLLAHAWLRYLGDLNGGQIIARLVRASSSLAGLPTAFYEFPALAEPRAAAAEWRARLDLVPLTADEQQAILAEAEDGFRRHIALFIALADQGETTSPRSDS